MKRTIVYCILSSILLLVLAFYFSGEIIDFILSLFYNSESRFVVTHVNEPFLLSVKLSLSIAVIPIIIMIAWFTGKISSNRKWLFSVMIIIGCIALSILLNVFRIQMRLNKIANSAYKSRIPIGQLYFEYAILIGAIFGLLITYFVFKNKRLNEDLNPAISEIGKPE